MYNKKLQELRKILKLSQEEISTQLGISYRAYSSYERGERKPPLEVLELLVNNYNVNLNWFIANIGEMFNKQQPSVNDIELEQKVVDVMKKYGIIEKWIW